MVGIPNEKGEMVFVNVEYLKWFKGIPPSMLEKLVEPVREERILAIGVRKNGKILEERVSQEERRIFSSSEEGDVQDEILFPELKHGQCVKLEGKLTRGNESSNTVGFEYQGHILNCVPAEGTIVRFKPALFNKCLLEGYVARHNHSAVSLDRRPTIIIENVFYYEDSDGQSELF